MNRSRQPFPWSSSFEDLPVPGATLADLVRDLADRFAFEEAFAPDAIARWRALGMVTDGGDGVSPTVAGMLLAGRDPRAWLPQARVEFAAFRVPRAELDDDLRAVPTRCVIDCIVIGGTIDQQILAACKRVTDTMRVEGGRGAGCVQVPQFDRGTVFEAIVNALVHRDYELPRPVNVLQFDDALEIRSPGDPLYAMDCTQLELRQASRNPRLCRLLSRIPAASSKAAVRPTFLLSRGEGVATMRQRTERLAGAPPRFAMRGGDLVVTIPAATASDHARSAR